MRINAKTPLRIVRGATLSVRMRGISADMSSRLSATQDHVCYSHSSAFFLAHAMQSGLQNMSSNRRTQGLCSIHLQDQDVSCDYW